MFYKKRPCSRQVIGWSIQPQLVRGLVMQAALMAVWQRSNTEPVILHSDRGTQYTAQEFQLFLKAHGIVSSMSGVGNSRTTRWRKVSLAYSNGNESIGGDTEPGQRPGPTCLMTSNGFTIASEATPLPEGWPQRTLWSNTINSLLSCQ